MELASLAVFGAKYGRTKQAVAKWKSKGLLVMHGGKIDVAASQARLRDHGILPRAVPSSERQPACDSPSTASQASTKVLADGGRVFAVSASDLAQCPDVGVCEWGGAHCTGRLVWSAFGNWDDIFIATRADIADLEAIPEALAADLADRFGIDPEPVKVALAERIREALYGQ